jgi:hypothetical protein
VADVADLTGADKVGEGAERLIDVGVRIVAVDLVKVDPVPSRRSESSASRMIQRRELPRWLGSSPIGMWTLLASTTSSRLAPASALPTMTSDSPCE